MIKRKEKIEGAVVLTLGIIFLILALMIRNNPVKLKGWINIVVQAKFLPIVIAIVVILLGMKMLIDAFRKTTLPNIENTTTKNLTDNNQHKNTTSQFEPDAWITILIIIGYFVLLPFIGFKIATALFLPGILLHLNLKRSKFVAIISVAAIFYVVTIYITPLVLGLRIN